MKKLLSRIGLRIAAKTLAGVAAVGTALALPATQSGCQGMNQSERNALGLIGGLVAVHPDATPRQAALGRGVFNATVRNADARQRQAQQQQYNQFRQRQYAIAWEMQQMPIDPNYVENMRRKWNSRQNLVLTYNSWNDNNNNGKIEFNELKGVKQRFKPHEPINIIAIVTNQKDKTLKVAVNYKTLEDAETETDTRDLARISSNAKVSKSEAPAYLGIYTISYFTESPHTPIGTAKYVVSD